MRTLPELIELPAPKLPADGSVIFHFTARQRYLGVSISRQGVMRLFRLRRGGLGTRMREIGSPELLAHELAAELLERSS
jgi:hypothetical protein